MLNMQQMLNEMKTPHTGFFIHCSAHADKYSFHLDYSKTYEGEGFKLRSGPHETAEEAVREVFEKWRLVTSATFKEAVPAAITYQPGDTEVSETAVN